MKYFLIVLAIVVATATIGYFVFGDTSDANEVHEITNYPEVVEETIIEENVIEETTITEHYFTEWLA